MTDHPEPTSDRFRSLADPATLRELADHLREGLYVTDAAGRFLDANAAFLAMLGMGSVEELATYTFDELVVDTVRRGEELQLLGHDAPVREFELQLRRPDGRVARVLDSCYVRRDPATGEPFHHGVVLDVTRDVELEAQLRELSLRDALTGCYNRRYLAELERGLGDEPAWGVIFVDLDDFKQFNERHGHHRGDEMLVRMSRFLVRQVRAEEAVVRLGGDEFLVVLVGANAQRTESVARRLQLAALRSAPVAFSLGWASRLDDEPFGRTVERADQELLTVRVAERPMEIERRE